MLSPCEYRFRNNNASFPLLLFLPAYARTSCILSREEWISYREAYQKKEKILEEQILYMAQEQKEKDCKTECLSKMKEYKAEEWMKRTILLEMIEEIIVEENEIEIVYRF